MLQTCQVQELEVHRLKIDDGHDPSSEEELRFFLKNQKNLTNLKLSQFHRESNFLIDETLNEVKFKLKKLRLKFIDLHTSNYFDKFVKNFKDSLTHLEVDKCHHELLELFTNFKNLKNLKIHHFCGHIEPILAVENLTLTHVDGKISEKFPNTKNLTVFYGVEDFQQISSLKKLEKLKIVDCEISNLKIPSTVKILSLEGISSDISKPFNFKESEIEKVSILKCKNCDFLIDFLMNFSFRLKFLQIEKSILSEEIQKSIFNSSKLVKCIELINCDGITEEDIDSSEDDDENESEESSESESENDDEVNEDDLVDDEEENREIPGYN